MLRRGLECNKSWIVLEDKVTILIPFVTSYDLLLPMMLVEESLGKEMY